jgi:hypothetical protein
MIADIVKGLIAPVTGLISEFIVDKDKANEIAFKISTLAANQAHENALGQMDINKQEAAHKNLFVSGWRPGLGWVCVLALGNNYIVVPYFVDAVTLDSSQLMPLIMGMLGLAGARTVEKVNNVAREK